MFRHARCYRSRCAKHEAKLRPCGACGPVDSLSSKNKAAAACEHEAATPGTLPTLYELVDAERTSGAFSRALRTADRPTPSQTAKMLTSTPASLPFTIAEDVVDETVNDAPPPRQQTPPPRQDALTFLEVDGATALTLLEAAVVHCAYTNPPPARLRHIAARLETLARRGRGQP